MQCLRWGGQKSPTPAWNRRATPCLRSAILRAKPLVSTAPFENGCLGRWVPLLSVFPHGQEPLYWALIWNKEASSELIFVGHHWSPRHCTQCLQTFPLSPQSKPAHKFLLPFDRQPWCSKELTNVEMVLLRFDSKPDWLPEGDNLSHYSEPPQKTAEPSVQHRWASVSETQFLVWGAHRLGIDRSWNCWPRGPQRAGLTCYFSGGDMWLLCWRKHWKWTREV